MTQHRYDPLSDPDWAFKAANRAKGSDPDTEEAFARLIGAEPPPDEVPPHRLHRWKVQWDSFWDDDTETTDWLIEPLIAKGAAHALYAGAKTGKSWVVLAAVAAASAGREFLGQPATEPITTLYVDYEMTRKDLRDRLEDFGYGPEDNLEHLHYLLLPDIPPLDTAGGADTLVSYARDIDADLVVIDTAGRAVVGEENAADTYRNLYRHTGRALKELGCSVIRIDHAGKEDSLGQRGSSAKNDDVDVVIKLTNTETGKLWKATHRRMTWYPEATALRVNEDQGIYSFEPASEMWPEDTTEIAGDLDALGVAVDAPTRAAQKALSDAGKGRQRVLVVAAQKWRQQQTPFT